MMRCRKSRLSLLVLAALVLAACQPGNINRVSLPYLSKGMSPNQVQAALQTPAKCSVLLNAGKGPRFDVYRLLSASYGVDYFLMFDSGAGGLRYWGSPSEFLRQADDSLAGPADKAIRYLQGKACSAGERWVIK